MGGAGVVTDGGEEVRDRYLAPGTHVSLRKIEDEGEHASPEVGVVVHCWMDPEHGFYDCYVAFFGDALPSGAPDDRPYILRYAATSLAVISS